MTDAGLKELKHFKALSWLNLNTTHVADAGLKELKALTWLCLTDTDVTDAGWTELRQALPDCQIFP